MGEGETLLLKAKILGVLKVLQKAYYGKVKCIIIDPPYNTGSDSFIYPDRFSEKKEDYLKRIGDKDEEGYLLKEGMFRKNQQGQRTFSQQLAQHDVSPPVPCQNLLRDDGVIFIHIDDNEVHNPADGDERDFWGGEFCGKFYLEKEGTTTNVEGAKVSSLTEYVICYQKVNDGLNYRVVPKENRSYPFSDELGIIELLLLKRKIQVTMREKQCSLKYRDKSQERR